MPSSAETLAQLPDEKLKRWHKKQKNPKGHQLRDYKPQHGSRNYLCITVHIDPETHEEVLKHAKKHGQFRSEALRELIEWGLLADLVK